jgi:hypothetical protein
MNTTTTVSTQRMDGEASDTLTVPLVARCRSLCDESRAICQRSAHLRQESAALLARYTRLRSEVAALLQVLFGTTPLSLVYHVAWLMLGSVPLLALELRKVLQHSSARRLSL